MQYQLVGQACSALSCKRLLTTFYTDQGRKGDEYANQLKMACSLNTYCS